MEHMQGDVARATAHAEEALALSHELDYRWGIAFVQSCLGLVAFEGGDPARARPMLEEALVRFRDLGDKVGLAYSLTFLGLVVHAEGDAERTKALLEESVALARAVQDKMSLAMALQGLGRLAHARGEDEQAAALHGESLTLRAELGDRRGVAECLEGFAAVSAAQAEPRRAARLFAAAEALREGLGTPPLTVDRAAHEPGLNAARSLIDETSWEMAWAKGRAMTPEQAIEYALSGEEPPAIPPPEQPPTREPTENLTRREREVTMLVAQGFTNRQIAKVLGISARTVETHVGRTLKKLGLSSRARLAAWMVEHHPLPEDLH